LADFGYFQEFVLIYLNWGVGLESEAMSQILSQTSIWAWLGSLYLVLLLKLSVAGYLFGCLAFLRTFLLLTVGQNFVCNQCDCAATWWYMMYVSLWHIMYVSWWHLMYVSLGHMIYEYLSLCAPLSLILWMQFTCPFCHFSPDFFFYSFDKLLIVMLCWTISVPFRHLLIQQAKELDLMNGHKSFPKCICFFLTTTPNSKMGVDHHPLNISH